MSELVERLLMPRTWKARCPDCLGDHSTRVEGAYTYNEVPRVVWRCPTCDGTGVVMVQRAALNPKGGQEA